MRCNIVDVYKPVPVSDLIAGTVFRIEGSSYTYMKTPLVGGYNCVILDSGCYDYVATHKLVIPRHDVVLVKE